MTLQKRLDYGFNGYEVPPVPRAARSARRHSFKKKADEFQMCAFDLLATVAGKLLLDGENPPPNTPGKDQSMTVGNSVGKEEKEEDKPPEDRDCYERNFLITEIVSEAPNPNHSPNKLACNQNAVMASGVTSSDGSEKIGSAEQLVNDDCKLSLGISTPSVDIESSGFRFSAHSGSDDDSRKDVKPDSATIRNLSISRKAPQFGSGHTEASDRKSSALVCLVDSVKFPFCRDGSFPVNGDNVKLVTKDDDDENSSECMELTTRNKAFKPPGDRRFRKFLAPNDCKVTSDDEGFTERCSYDRKNGVKRQRPLRPLRDYPFKKRKLYDCSTASNSDESITADGNGKNEDGIGYIPATPAAIAAPPTSAGGGYASFHSRNSQVKLRIKSFRVPELFIEIPESATVGSLKRMVMESVNTVLGDGLRVGVILQGKKIRDDSKTLLQSGIAHDKKLDTLGFSLERSLAPAPAPIRSYPEDCPSPMVCENPQPLARHPSTPIITENGGQQGSQEIHLNNFIESDHDSAPSPPGIPLQKQDALAIVPLRKSKRSESTQRRIRRPFTVSEVEALVQAVEKLGTGRWRDVKLRAFDNAKHRTYVDLKDKWKTLVHTAGISPQQRRGEPVPQELLDRVLTAHAYWSHHQPKHHLNSHPLSALFL